MFHYAASFQLNTVQNAQKFVSFTRRKLLEQASNLAAAPAPAGGESPSGQIIALPTTRSSGAFPAVPNAKSKQSNPPALLPSPAAPPPRHTSHEPSQNSTVVSGNPTQQHSSSGSSGNMWKIAIIVAGVAVLLIVAAAMLCMCRSQAVKTIGPWKTGISGQLQKAFITGDLLICNKNNYGIISIEPKINKPRRIEQKKGKRKLAWLVEGSIRSTIKIISIMVLNNDF